jgi:hypothetical protein
LFSLISPLIDEATISYKFNDWPIGKSYIMNEERNLVGSRIDCKQKEPDKKLFLAKRR